MPAVGSRENDVTSLHANSPCRNVFAVRFVIAVAPLVLVHGHIAEVFPGGKEHPPCLCASLLLDLVAGADVRLCPFASAFLVANFISASLTCDSPKAHASAFCSYMNLSLAQLKELPFQ